MRSHSNFIIALACLTLAGTAIVFSSGTARAQNGAQLYSEKCASCHGASGKGDGVAAKYLHPKPADFGTSLKGKSDDWIAKAITGGGKAVGEAPIMPAYPNMTPDQVKSLVDYIKKFSS